MKRPTSRTSLLPHLCAMCTSPSSRRSVLSRVVEFRRPVDPPASPGAHTACEQNTKDEDAAQPLSRSPLINTS